MKASFSEASGLDTEQDPVDYRTGPEDVTVRKAPDLQKSSPTSPFLGWLFGGFQNAAKKRQEQIDAVINGNDIPPPSQGSDAPPSPPPASRGGFFSNFFGGGTSGKSLRDTLRDRKYQTEHAADDDYIPPPPREPDTPPDQGNSSSGFFSNFFGGRRSRSNQPPPKEPPSLADVIRRRKEQIEKFGTGEEGDPLIEKNENKGNDPFATADGVGVGGFMGGGSGGPGVDARSMQESNRGSQPQSSGGSEGHHHHHGPGGGDY